MLKVKPNKLTPGLNLLWESSRMMLPEHKEVLQRHQKELDKRIIPLFDEQQNELFSHVIVEAIKQNKDVKIQYFHPYEDRYIVGKIEKISPERDKIRISSKDNDMWICLSEVLDISFP
ncbi:YolD-like family protein [Virgibacillus soli]|uniref:YolD-like family protein n=1 Tax=Paracerasibacillus soli TaxID=480284 RepID=UPI0035E6CB83